MKNSKKIFLGLFIIAAFAVVLFSFVFIFLPKNPDFASLPDNSAPEKKNWGAYAGNTASSFFDFEQMIGERPDIKAVFVGWHKPFPTDLALTLKANSQTLVIFWEQYGTTLDEIISGKSDDYIVQFAKDAKFYGGPVILAPLHEMNGDWSPWSGTAGDNTSEKIILTFRRIHDIFAPSGGANVRWGWVVNNESVPDTKENAIESYYPGDDYVDYVGVDGFNFGEPWKTYSEIFSPALEKLRKYQKPIYIFSMASAEGPKKADWIKDALYKIRTDPSVKGFIWFNENKEKNWLINSDAESLRTFKDGIK